MATTKHGQKIVLEAIKKNIVERCNRLLEIIDADETPVEKQRLTMMLGGTSNKLAYYARIIIRWKMNRIQK